MLYINCLQISLQCHQQLSTAPRDSPAVIDQYPRLLESHTVRIYTVSDRFVVRIECTLGGISIRSMQVEHTCCQIATTVIKQLLSVCAKYGNFLCMLHSAYQVFTLASRFVRVCESLCDSERYIAHSSSNDLLLTTVQ